MKSKSRGADMGLIRRGIEVFLTEGPQSFFRKTRGAMVVKLVNPWASSKFGTNSKRYWDTRLTHSWDQVGGDNQTSEFARGMQRNLGGTSLQNIQSVLDWGCATGDSIPVLHEIFPNARKFMHDLSDVGVSKALKKYNSFSPQKWSKGVQVDFVYSSNVIEHVPEPSSFVLDLTGSATKHVLVQCPWEEFGPDGNKLTPEKPQGEHVWTVDIDFLYDHFPLQNWRWQGRLDDVPNAWPFGKQLFLLGTKLSDGEKGNIVIS